MLLELSILVSGVNNDSLTSLVLNISEIGKKRRKDFYAVEYSVVKESWTPHKMNNNNSPYFVKVRLHKSS